MDQGTEEASVAPNSELVKARYVRLRDVFLKNETVIDGILWEAESQGKKGENSVARAIPLLHLLKVDQADTRMLLEWVKMAFDVEENQMENAFKGINDFVKQYGPMLKEIREERERFKGIRPVGT